MTAQLLDTAPGETVGKTSMASTSVVATGHFVAAVQPLPSASGTLLDPGTSAAADDWLMPLLDKLKTFSGLPLGWDGYRANPPSGLAVYQAEDFLFALRRADVQPKRVGPSVIGGVGITIRSGECRAYVEFYNDGRVYVMLSAGESEPEIHPVRTEYRDYENLISEIRRYLHA